jgi:hypothetical protein
VFGIPKLVFALTNFNTFYVQPIVGPRWRKVDTSANASNPRKSPKLSDGFELSADERCFGGCSESVDNMTEGCTEQATILECL